MSRFSMKFVGLFEDFFYKNAIFILLLLEMSDKINPKYALQAPYQLNSLEKVKPQLLLYSKGNVVSDLREPEQISRFIFREMMIRISGFIFGAMLAVNIYTILNTGIYYG